MEKIYWKGVEELHNDPEAVRLKHNEFFEHLPVDEVLGKKADANEATPRRDFLKFLGFGIAAASLAACEAPVRKAVPYLIKPEEITPGVPNYYASTYADGHDYCSIVVKTREGRPIKIEGNELSGVTKGGVNARVQASVLSLYDSARLKGPLANHLPVSWNTIDEQVKPKLADIASRNGKIRILSSTIISPSTKNVIEDFTKKYPATRHISYDAISRTGMLMANETCFDLAALPQYHFENAAVIVGIGCDFLVNWIAPIEHARQYAATRKLRGKKNMSRHIQFEANLSLTGSNADNRYPVKPSEYGAVILSLYNKVAALAGATVANSVSTSVEEAINKTAKELWEAKGKALVVSGSNDVNEQILVNGINSLLMSYDSCIDIQNHCHYRQGDDAALAELIGEINAGEVEAIIFYNSNPCYTLPDSKSFAAALSKVKVKISFADREDETAKLCDYVCPDSHYLESWNDSEPYRGKYSLTQPTIEKLFKTRQAQESLLVWADAPVNDYHLYIQENWRNTFALPSGISSHEAFWNRALQDGAIEITSEAKTSAQFKGDVNTAASTINMKPGQFELLIYEKTGMGNGNQANNPWLLEFPDPVSKVCWDNYLALNPNFAKQLGVEQNNVVELKMGNGNTVKVPVYIQPGQAMNTGSLALGYGRTAVGKAGDGVGVNAYPLTSIKNGTIQYYSADVTVSKTTDEDYKLAATQLHHTMMGREIVKETTLVEYQKDPKAGNEPELVMTPDGPKPIREVNLWATKKNPGFDKPNHFWGMAIDLNSCIGCGACVVACTAENNVPVVGKSEIMRSREMHWIRIDRYYTSDMTKEIAEEKHVGKIEMYRDMEQPTADNPSVVFQPVMCQHCNHAPCETVCPVVATTHGSDGLNMMAYNRCVGTRYCENNCPYKVRRFNWFRYNENEQFPYNMKDDLGKMVLNPDVVVRSRGVMEKCSMCVQRIQAGKLQAKKEERRPIDGEIKTACMQTCPTNAIIFGDTNDPDSEVSQLMKDERTYHLLEELDTQPSVFYHTKVRNREEKEA